MANFYPLLAYLFVATFTPGPNHILAKTNGLRDGYRETLGFLAGIFTGFCLVMLACGFLNVALIKVHPQVRLGLNLPGAADSRVKPPDLPVGKISPLRSRGEEW